MSAIAWYTFLHKDSMFQSNQVSQLSWSVVSSTTGAITILVPQNLESYVQEVNEYVDEWGNDPTTTWIYESRQIEYPSSEDLKVTTAEYAANLVSLWGGPSKATVEYFKVIDGTAYILFNFNLDAWAWVSHVVKRVQPIVEKNLLQFEDVDRVVFGYAPWDK